MSSASHNSPIPSTEQLIAALNTWDAEHKRGILDTTGTVCSYDKPFICMKGTGAPFTVWLDPSSVPCFNSAFYPRSAHP